MRTILIAAALAGLPMFGGPAAAAEPLKVVASFSILADMTRTIGGDRVAVTSLVGPGGDPHVFQPSPQDARAVAEADLVIINGLGFEGWMDRLIEASGYDGPVVVASKEVVPLAADGSHADEADAHDAHGHDVYDPHAWQDAGNAALYAAAICGALEDADPAGKATYTASATAYEATLTQIDGEIRARFAALPTDRRTVLTTHDAFGYFAHAYGLTFLAPQGLSTESEPSARDVAALIRQIRDEGVEAVFIEALSDDRLVRQIAQETGAIVGGELYADTLSAADGPASTYIAMMRHNAAAIATALAGGVVAARD